MTLAEFVAARLDEDEAAALSATMMKDNEDSRHWHVDREPWAHGAGIVDGTSDGKGAVAVAPGSYKAAHIARHDPARVLREVEAKRKILKDWQVHEETLDRGYTDIVRGAQLALRAAVRDLAAVYSDHPDYDPAWG